MSAAVTSGAAAGIDGRDRVRVHEKMVDRYAVPFDRVELPVHGDGIGMKRVDLGGRGSSGSGGRFGEGDRDLL